jgi:hypothetical protein
VPLLLIVIVGAAGVGLLLGRSLRTKQESGKETFGVLRAALIGFMGLILAFGLSLAVGRYEARRQAVVDDANAIGTAYLTVAAASALQRPLWKLAAQAVEEQPVATAPRLYEDSLNEMINQQTVRVAGLGNRVSTEVLLVEIVGAAFTLSLIGLHVGVLGRGLIPLLLAAVMVATLVYTIIDLDRPTRGLIRVPDTPIAQLRASMNLPPAAGNP